MKHFLLSTFVLFLVSVTSQATEPKLKGLLRFADNPQQNEFIIDSDCKLGKNSTRMDERLVNRCKEDLKEQNYNLRLNYINDFIRYLIYGTKGGKLFVNDKTDAYAELYPLVLDREKSFRALASAECEMSYYCGGGCGQGDIDSGRGCLFDKIQKRSDYLDSEIVKGIPLYNVDLNTNNIFLITDKFEIKLKSNCKSGFFLCDDVEYSGKSKSSYDSIKLKGKPYFGRRAGSQHPHQLGVYFLNGDYEYYVDFSGILEVVNAKKNKSILKENGTWKRNP